MGSCPYPNYLPRKVRGRGSLTSPMRDLGGHECDTYLGYGTSMPHDITIFKPMSPKTKMNALNMDICKPC